MTSKERWRIADKVAEALSIEPQVAFNGIPTLQEHDLLNGVLEHDPESVRKAFDLQWYGRRLPYAQQEHQEPTEIDVMAGHLQIMLWAVRKIGSLDKAAVAFAAVKKALEDGK